MLFRVLLWLVNHQVLYTVKSVLFTVAAVHGSKAAGRCSECSLQLLFMEISELLFSVL